MILSLENAIPTELITKIRSRCHEQLSIQDNSVFGRFYNRTGKTINITETPSLADLDKDISAFVSYFTESLIKPVYRPMYGVADSGYEFHRYAPGEQCFVHADGEVVFYAGNTTSLIRFATVIFHLNTVHDGGETVFPNQDKTFKTLEGQILVFPPYSMYPHYVTPAETPRDILITWLVYDGINASKTK